MANLNITGDLTIGGQTPIYVIETYMSSDNSEWYRKWSDGWIECGGTFSPSTSGSSTVTFPSGAFSNTSYTITATAQYAEGGSSLWWVFTHTKNTSSAVLWHGWKGISSTSGSKSSPNVSWYACGY